jgi:Tol biopolymer transport system component
MTFTPKDISGMPDFAVSPDGSRLAFVASGPGARGQLWVQELASAAAQPLPGTTDATGPFWAPDNRSLAFYAQGKLKKVSLGGAAPQDLADVVVPVNSGAWGKDGTILFGGLQGAVGGLFRISAEGGQPVPVTNVDASRGEVAHVWPQFLPDGRRFIFYVRSAISENGGVYLGSIDSGGKTQILRSTANAAYASPGYLLFELSGNLMVQPFDANAGVLSGQASALGDRVSSLPAPGYLGVSIGADGTMAYWNGQPPTTELQWFERNGRPLGQLSPRKAYQSPALSPDARKVLVGEQVGSNRELSNIDVSSGVTTRVTLPGVGAAMAGFGIWSPDGKDLVYSTIDAAGLHIQQRAASGIGQQTELLGPPALFPEDWSRDGRWLLYSVIPGKTASDIWAFNVAERKPRPIVEEPATQVQARLSPDSRWLAYTSDESGDWEVYVQPFPDGQGKWQVSTGGGSQPLWRGDSKELFYIAADNRLVAVPIAGTQTFEVGVSQPLFATRIPPVLAPWRTNYAVSSDGQRFLVNSVVPEATPNVITIAVNWQKR